MATPLVGSKTSSCIEEFFKDETLGKELGGKVFDYSKDADKNKTYDKVVFAHKVVAAEAATIDFSGFNQLLANLTLLLNEHFTKFPPS
jgi:hypothetical protein